MSANPLTGLLELPDEVSSQAAGEPASIVHALGTVAGTAPVTVVLDGASAVPAPAMNAAGPLRGGDRVLVEHLGRRLIVLGRIDGPTAAYGGWRAAALENGWTAANGYQAPRFRRVGDRVELDGVMTGGTQGSAAIAFVLPPDCRPSKPVLLPAVTLAQPQDLRVSIYGSLLVYAATPTYPFVSLAGLSFYL